MVVVLHYYNVRRLLSRTISTNVVLYINALFFCLKVVKIILLFIFICVLYIGNLKQKKIKIKLAQKFLNLNKLTLLAVEHVVSDTQGILYSFHHEFHNRFYRALLSKAR